jgi:hypothetical protein
MVEVGAPLGLDQRWQAYHSHFVGRHSSNFTFTFSKRMKSKASGQQHQLIPASGLRRSRRLLSLAPSSAPPQSPQTIKRKRCPEQPTTTIYIDFAGQDHLRNLSPRSTRALKRQKLAFTATPVPPSPRASRQVNLPSIAVDAPKQKLADSTSGPVRSSIVSSIPILRFYMTLRRERDC